MRRSFVQRAAIAVLILASVTLVMVRNKIAATASTQAKSLAASRKSTVDSSGYSRMFFQGYDYCYLDKDGRPMIVHRKRLIFFRPEAPQDANDQTFIETARECR